MQISVVNTAHRITSEDGLEGVLSLIPKLVNGTVVAVASKLFSVLTNCRVPKKEVEWSQLLDRESDAVFPAPAGCPDYCLTLKMGRLLVNAGIDHSNGGGDYMLLPRNLQQLTEQLWHRLRDRDQVKQLGLIVTDSCILPLRRGVIGVALAWCGIEAVYDYQGSRDLDGNAMEVTAINVVDSLATVATLMMGEGAESTPVALVTGVDEHIKFVSHAPSSQDLQKAQISLEQDLYSKVMTYDKMDRS